MTNICRDWAIDAAHDYASYLWSDKEYSLLKEHYESSEERFKRSTEVQDFKNNLLEHELYPKTAIYSQLSCPEEGLLFAFSCAAEAIKGIEKTPTNTISVIDDQCANRIGQFIFTRYKSRNK